MILEQAVEKLSIEFDNLGIGVLMINKGYPIFEIWIEDIYGDEVLIHSFFYKNLFESNNIDEIGLLNLEEIMFDEVEEKITYQKLKELVYIEILKYYENLREKIKNNTIIEFSFIMFELMKKDKSNIVNSYGTIEKAKIRYSTLKEKLKQFEIYC